MRGCSSPKGAGAGRTGKAREVLRGPETLTADGETSMGMTRNQVLEMELEGLGNLIRLINQYGCR